MAHLHEVRDADTHYIIDPITMAITNANEAKNKLMLGDHGSEIYTFELPEYVEGHNMGLCNMVEVHFINIGANKADQSVGVYPVNDLAIAEDAAGTLVFTWKVSGECTMYPGSLNYRIKFACTDESGNYTYKKWTDVYKGITISDGFDNGAAIAAEYSDILSAWEARLDALEQGGGVPSWNDLTDKPFGEEPINPYFDGDITGRETVQVGDGVRLVKMSDSVISEADCIGAELIVDLDGEQQTIPVTEDIIFDLAEMIGVSGFCISELFVTVVTEPGSISGIAFDKGTYYLYSVSNDMAGYTKYFSALSGTVVKKMDPKYLPEHLPYTETKKVTILDETLTDPDEGRFTINEELPIEAGKTYTVTFNGTKYVCTAQEVVFDYGTSIYLGNGENYEGTGNGEPFLVGVGGGGTTVINFNWLESQCTIKIEGETEVIHKLPEEYLPEIKPFGEGVELIHLDITTMTLSKTGEEICNLQQNGKVVYLAEAINARVAADSSSNKVYIDTMAIKDQAEAPYVLISRMIFDSTGKLSKNKAFRFDITATAEGT